MRTITLKRWGAAAATCGALLAGIAVSEVSAGNGSGSSAISTLDRPGIDVGDLVADTSRVDPASAVLARRFGDDAYYLTEDRLGGICLVRAQGDAERVSATCGDSSVIDEFGAVPLVEVFSDGSITLAAIVEDGVEHAPSGDGAPGTVEGNVLLMRVAPEAEGVALSNGATIPIARWRD